MELRTKKYPRGWYTSDGMPEMLNITSEAYRLLVKGKMTPRRRSLFYTQDIRPWAANLPRAIAASNAVLAANAKSYDRILSVPEMLGELTAQSEAALPELIESRSFIVGNDYWSRDWIEVMAHTLQHCKLLAAYRDALRAGGLS